jgi:PAS domain S-box-containing protein
MASSTVRPATSRLRSARLRRLIVELLAVVALSALAVECAKSALSLPSGIAGGTLRIALLLGLAAPLLVWRCRVAVRDGGAPERSAAPVSARWLALLAIAVLATGLAITLSATAAIRSAEHQRMETELTRLTDRIRTEVDRRLNKPLDALKGARGVYAASRSVERGEFRAYVRSRDLAEEFPGVRGLGFIQRVQRAELAAFVERQRADEAPGFEVRSVGEAADLYVIVFIEPLLYNRPAWGYDVGSEPVRREAAERAVTSGQPALSGRIVLVQDGRKGPGFLLLVPVYRNGSLPQSPDERLAALTGLVYAPIVVADLMHGVADAADRLIDVELYDGPAPVLAERIFDAEVGDTDALVGDDSEAAKIEPITFAGRTLTLKTTATAAFDGLHAERTSTILAIAGSVLSLLLATTVWLLGRGRAQAMVLAEEMTADLAEATASAEAALRENEVLHRTIQQHAIVSITDRAGVIIAVNPAFCVLSGYAEADLVGATHARINSGVHPPEFWREMWKTISSGRPWRGEVCNRAKDGSLYWVDSIIAPFTGEDGRIEKYISIRTDITARKTAEAGLLQANRDLAQQTALANELANRAELASQAKSSFLANMSHEIRTPMNGVLGMTELMLGMDLNAEQRDAAQTVYRSAEALLAILNDILDFSKIEAGRLDLERIPFDVQQLVFDVVELFRGRVAGGPVELLVRIAPGAPGRVLGDPGRVRQILTNLAGNAVKFTEHGHILIELGGGDDEVLLSVSDTGIGIPADRRAILFAPFTQVDASTSRRFGGTGLGLAICRQLAEAMGGSIALDSEVGSGSTFRVRLALARDPAPPPTVAPAASLAGRRVLVVDDSITNRAILCEQLAAVGCQAELAAGSDQAWSLLNDPPGGLAFDAAIIDRHMPMVDGESLAVQIAADGRFAAMALVLLTSSGLRGDAARVQAAGFAGYLVKPAAGSVLCSVVATAIERVMAGRRTLVTRHQIAEAMPAREPELPAGPKRRILVAEDNPVNQRVARAMLERLGYEVLVVADGRAAVDAAAKGGFDLVLMDCQMPVLDGYAATRAIRQSEGGSGRHLPIVAMTANAMDEDRERCASAGMDGHLAKPVRKADLEAAVNRWCRTG